MSIIAKLATDQAIADHLTADQLNHAIGYARKMANVTTDIDRFQWLAIQAALEAMQAPPSGKLPASRMVSQPERIAQ